MSLVTRVIGIVTAWYVLIILALSSFLVNLGQVVSFALFFVPYKNRLDYSQRIANTWWEIFCFITECWAAIPYRWSGDTPMAESAVLLGNHERGIDFVNGVVVVSRVSEVRCGRMMVLMKGSLQYYPTVGFTHFLQGSIFLKRNWEKDQTALTKKFSEMEGGLWPKPFWVGIYPEGTRITDKKRQQSHEFARKNNLPILNNVLLPRTKGFTFLLDSLPTSLDAIYDVCIGYERSHLDLVHALFSGNFRTKSIAIHIERIPMSTLPKDEKGRSDWLMNRYKRKDELLEYFKEKKCFPGELNVEEETKRNDRRERFTRLFTLWSTAINIAAFTVSGLKPTVLVCMFALQILTLIHSSRKTKENTNEIKKNE